MSIILTIITIISIAISICCVNYKKEIDNKIQQLNIELQNNINVLKVKKEMLEASIEEEQSHLKTITNEIQSKLDNQTSLSQKAYENYCKILEQQYKQTEEEYDNLNKTLEKSYDLKQLSLLAEINSVEQDLDKIKATRAAAIEAQRKEKEIRENSTFYCLQLSDEDKADIQRLENIKKTLNKPRVLSMLIWQTWYQKPLKTLSANVLGTSNDITGIYKITNIITNECYIGQAVSIASRWAEHAKCGLGIDTPAGNKLYKAMQEYGLYSFSWELLEKCPREELNEKEHLYISLYQADSFGYNSNVGIKK